MMKNLLIYTCLTNKELNEVFDQIEKNRNN